VVTEGFERAAGLFGAFVLSIPGCIGGALAGGIFSRAKTAEKSQSERMTP